MKDRITTGCIQSAILRPLGGEKEIEAGAGYELDEVLKEAGRLLENAKH